MGVSRGAGLAGIALAWGLAGCGGAHGTLDRQMAALIPADTQALACVHVDQLRGTPIYATLVQLAPLKGLDTGVHDALIANNGRGTLLVVRGSLGNSGTQVDRDLAVTGSDDLVRAAVAQHRRGRVGSPDELLARADRMPKDVQIWAVAMNWAGVPAGVMALWKNAANLNRVLQMAPVATLTVDLRAGIRAEATGECRTEQDAVALADSLRGLLSLARMAQSKATQISNLADSAKIAQNGRIVRLDAAVTDTKH